MKKLKTVLRELEPTQKIKVGSKGASMFWYVGTVDDMLQNIPVYNAYCELHIERLMKRAEARLKNAINAYPSPANYVKAELQTSTPNLTTEGYLKALDAWFLNVINLNEKKTQKERWNADYGRISERDVLEVAMCDPRADYGVVRIIIRGHESGKYWMYDEAPRIPSCAFLNETEGEDE